MPQPGVAAGVRIETMPRIRHKLVLRGVLAAATVCCAAFIARSARPEPEMSLARVVDVRDTNILSSVDFRFPIDDTNEDWVVVIRVHNLGSRTLTLGHEKVQCRVSGQWLPPEEVGWLNSMHFVATVKPRSEDDFVVAVVPRQTESVRLNCEYRYESLAERWYNLAGYYSSPGYTRLSHSAAWACGCLRSWVLAPLRCWSFPAHWPKIVQEFRLPVAPQTIAREHNEVTSVPAAAEFHC
jgi:hypothetical protein